MVQLHKDVAQFKELGLQIVGISPDSVDVLKSFADQSGVSFPLLSDQGSRVIRAYGLHFQEGLPQPGTIVIDKSGMVRAALLREGYRDRHSNEDLIEAAKGIAAQ